MNIDEKLREILVNYYEERKEWDSSRRQVFEGRTELNAKFISQIKALIEEEILDRASKK